jgi:hypothetical protein
MILAHQSNGQTELSDSELAHVRQCWLRGVPLRGIARAHGLTEPELRLQLEDYEIVRQMAERQRQLEALKERYGSRLDGR